MYLRHTAPRRRSVLPRASSAATGQHTSGRTHTATGFDFLKNDVIAIARRSPWQSNGAHTPQRAQPNQPPGASHGNALRHWPSVPMSVPQARLSSFRSSHLRSVHIYHPSWRSGSGYPHAIASVAISKPSGCSFPYI